MKGCVPWLLLLSCPTLDMAPPGSFVSCANFSADIQGEPDRRPQTWGTAGFHVWPIKFRDEQTTIFKVWGDLIAWPKGEVPRGTYYGVLVGLMTTAPEGSKNCDWCADNTFLYFQGAGSRRSPVVRIPFDVQVQERLSDGIILVKVAVFLNDTGLPVHVEPTVCISYGPKGPFMQPGINRGGESGGVVMEQGLLRGPRW